MIAKLTMNNGEQFRLESEHQDFKNFLNAIWDKSWYASFDGKLIINLKNVVTIRDVTDEELGILDTTIQA